MTEHEQGATPITDKFHFRNSTLPEKAYRDGSARQLLYDTLKSHGQLELENARLRALSAPAQQWIAGKPSEGDLAVPHDSQCESVPVEKLKQLKWASVALELAMNGLRNRRGLVLTGNPATSDTEMWNLHAAMLSIQSLLAARTQVTIPDAQIENQGFALPSSASAKD